MTDHSSRPKINMAAYKPEVNSSKKTGKIFMTFLWPYKGFPPQDFWAWGIVGHYCYHVYWTVHSGKPLASSWNFWNIFSGYRDIGTSGLKAAILYLMASGTVGHCCCRVSWTACSRKHPFSLWNFLDILLGLWDKGTSGFWRHRSRDVRQITSALSPLNSPTPKT